MIKVEHEPKDLRRWPAEECCFCRKPTRFWYMKKDVAVCKACAAVRKVKEIPSKAEWCSNSHR